VAIYSPASSIYFGGFEAGGGKAPGAVGGGAERQMATLAEELAERDLRVALIIWPVERPDGLSPNLEFVERPRHVGTGARFGKLREAARVWRACAAADAYVYVYRGGGPLLFAVAVFCRLRRRKLIFSAANDRTSISTAQTGAARSSRCTAAHSRGWTSSSRSARSSSSWLVRPASARSS
jgi:hypothetical protein